MHVEWTRAPPINAIKPTLPCLRSAWSAVWSIELHQGALLKDIEQWIAQQKMDIYASGSDGQ